MFGVVESSETTEAEFAILNKATEIYLCVRTAHPTHRLFEGSGGRTRLTMKARDMAELGSWILSLMPWVEVVRPARLREEIRHRLREGPAHHERARQRTGR